MLEIVYGQTRNQTIADSVVGALEPLGFTGTIYIGYPVLAAADEPISIDALLVCKERGLVAFLFEATVPPENDESTWRRL